MMLPAQPPQFVPAQLQAIVEQMRPQQAAPQLDAARLQAVIEQIRMQREAQQNPLAEAFVGIVRVVAVGAAIGLGAGRAVPRGREMCGRCHFYCGHNGNWKNYAINPKGCWLDSFK